MIKIEADICDPNVGIRFNKLEKTGFKTRAAAITAAKRWAAGRGDEPGCSGRYVLTVWDRTHEGYGILLEAFRYSGKCERAQA